MVDQFIQTRARGRASFPQHGRSSFRKENKLTQSSRNAFKGKTLRDEIKPRNADLLMTSFALSHHFHYFYFLQFLPLPEVSLLKNK